MKILVAPDGSKSALRAVKCAAGLVRSIRSASNAIRTGRVLQEIAQFFKSGEFDLIVVGSKGRSAIADLLLVSVAQRVPATAKQPVVRVK